MKALLLAVPLKAETLRGTFLQKKDKDSQYYPEKKLNQFFVQRQRKLIFGDYRPSSLKIRSLI